MGLGYSPKVRVEGAGQALINSRLVSWERVDASGVESDQVMLVVNTEGIGGIPKEGAVLSWFEGYEDEGLGLVSKGDFKITRIEPVLFPPSVTITATAAPFQIQDETRFKERKTKTYEAISFAELFRQVVTPHGFSPRVAPEFESDIIEHVDQVNETDAAFLTRLASKRDAIAKPVNDLYVLARRGQLSTITGKDIPLVNLSVPEKNSAQSNGFVNCRLVKASRSSLSGVRASWANPDSGEEIEVSVGVSPYKKIRQVFESESVAVQACTDELKKIKRQGASVSLSVPGDPDLVAEGLLNLDDSFPAAIAGQWSIDRVVARGDAEGGYRCSVEATQPQA